jgi:CubicO group peptidase (beta-lactamase class C family)
MRRALLAALAVLLVGCTSTDSSTNSASTSSSASSGSSGSTPASTASSATLTSSSSTDPALAAQIMAVVNDSIQADHLRAVLIKVTIDGQEVVRQAVGESMTGVPATTEMHFRNGAVAISYMSTLLLILVDEGTVSLDDKLSKWLPDVPHSDEVNLGQLAQMTSGYVDFEQTPELNAALYADPFKQWTPQELLAFAVDKPLLYPPGTNWNYAHTNYVLLGLAMEKITGKDLATLLQEKVLDPLALDNTGNNLGTPAIPEPVLHAFSSERRQTLQIPASIPFYEESTFWNPSWTLAQGAIQTTNLDDLAATAEKINSGQLLTPESYSKLITTDLRGKTTAIPGCGSCFEQSVGYSYGFGMVTSGNWVLQDPLFAGESAVDAYLPSQKVAIAVALTYQPAAFDATTGQYKNVADQLWRKIGAVVAPSDPTPMK